MEESCQKLADAADNYLFVKRVWHAYGPNLGVAQKRLEQAVEEYRAAQVRAREKK